MTPQTVHFTVEDLGAGIGFYSTMFTSMPTVLGADQASWSLDDPPMNFIISRRRDAAAAADQQSPEHFSASSV
jgi:hypothetical protein